MSGFEGIIERFKDIQDDLDELKGIFLDKRIDLYRSLVEPENHFEQSVLSSLIVKNIEITKEQVGVLQGLLNIYSGNGIGTHADERMYTNTQKETKAEIKQKEYTHKNEVKKEEARLQREVMNLAEKIYPMGLDIIKLRDQLLIAGDGADEAASKMISGIYNELGRLLSLNGIDPIEDDGAFDKMRHQVVQTLCTETKELAGKIAGTVRPGYCTKNTILRPQEIILYKYKTED